MVNGDVALFVSEEVTGSLRFPAPVPDMGDGVDNFTSVFEQTYDGKVPDRLARQAYDAVIVVALAIQKAEAWRGREAAEAISDVANAPGKVVHAGQFDRALRLLAEGEDIDYEGASGVIEFDERGDVERAAAMFRLANGKQVKAD